MRESALMRQTNKYHAKRTYSVLCGRFFDSKLEAKHGEELKLLAMAGEICELDYQVRFVLSEEPLVTITIDFVYFDRESHELIYADTKGVLTRDFRTKLAWLKEKYGIEVKLIRE